MIDDNVDSTTTVSMSPVLCVQFSNQAKGETRTRRQRQRVTQVIT